MGLTKSSISSVLATAKDLTTTLLFLEMLQLRIFWMIDSPAVTVIVFLAFSLLLLLAPACFSFEFDDDLVDWLVFSEPLLLCCVFW